MRHALLLLAALPLTPALAADPEASVPRAIYLDPPVDSDHPASTLAVEIPSHGAVMNGIVYRPSGPGPFPLVIFLHGLPGNEQHLDLAQALRRAGWAVLTFHYRGAFGSEGAFSIDHVLEDADAAVVAARAPGTAKAWNIDPARIVMMGHSMGGLAAAHAARGDPARIATVLLAPWDPSVLREILTPLSPADRTAFAFSRWSDVGHGRLRGTTTPGLLREILAHGERWTLADSAAALATRPLLLVTATHDLRASQATRLRPALGTAKVDAVELDSNHSFDDHRIALETTVLRWLAKLPGAPPER